MIRLQDLISDGVLQLDQALRIAESNPAVSLMLGLDHAQLAGRQVQELFPSVSPGSDFLLAVGSPSDAPDDGARTWSLIAKRADGADLPVEVHLFRPIEQSSVCMIVRRAAERSVAVLIEELQDCGRKLKLANRLKRDFLGRINHELRTPLHNVVGSCELLREQKLGPLNRDQGELLEIIWSDGERLLSIVSRLLDLGALEAGRSDLKREEFDLREPVERAVAGIRDRAEAKGIQVRPQFPDAVPVRADMQRVFQILGHLLDNAVKFTPDFGKIGITISKREGFLWVSVTDTGPGIPPANYPAVMEGFYQSESNTHRVRDGIGIGLALARHLTELHGGRIWIENDMGNGNKVVFTLPSDGA